MSGGYYDYKYYNMDEYINDMRTQDPVIAAVMEDIKNICHDLEWYKSGEINEEDLNRSLEVFKRRWFRESILDYCDKVEEYCTKLRKQLNG